MGCFSRIGKAFTAIKNALFPKTETGVTSSSPVDNHDQQQRSLYSYSPGYHVGPSPCREMHTEPIPPMRRMYVTS